MVAAPHPEDQLGSTDGSSVTSHVPSSSWRWRTTLQPLGGLYPVIIGMTTVICTEAPFSHHQFRSSGSRPELFSFWSALFTPPEKQPFQTKEYNEKAYTWNIPHNAPMCNYVSLH